VNETVSRDAEASQQEDAVATAAPGGTRLGRRGRRAAMVVVVLVAAGAGAACATGVFWSRGSSGGRQGTPPPATQSVVREDLSAQTPVSGTLGYTGLYTVRGQGTGTLTWLPSAGQVIGQGQVLYRVDNGNPVVLLYGSVPAWRTLAEGLTGADVSQLNHDLVALGYASASNVSALGWDYFSWETASGIQQMESARGVSNPPGSLSLGSVVFEPEAIRVTSVLGSLGAPAAGPVLAATSDKHVVTVALSTSQESGVAAGDAVTVTLPDGGNTAGTISSVGTVASGSASSATIQVTVTLHDPSVAGTLDEAPVTVYITTASVSNVLAVPVGALLAQSSGGYAVEVVGPDDTRHLVPVTVGIFNDNSGLVQVTGALTPGQKVVVPAI
jgi:multidrug efflux pump subunit AcrA (membrane-fusion protein)